MTVSFLMLFLQLKSSVIYFSKLKPSASLNIIFYSLSTCFFPLILMIGTKHLLLSLFSNTAYTLRTLFEFLLSLTFVRVNVDKY